MNTARSTAGRPRPLGRALGAAGLCALVAAAQAQSPAPVGPRVNLTVEVRQVEERQTPAAPHGAVIVHSDGRIEGVAPGALGRAPDAWDSRRREHQRESVQQLRVLNGGTASLRVARATPWQFLEVRWSQDYGLQVEPATRWVEAEEGWEVQPQWPGGTSPVAVTIRTAQRRVAGRGPAEAAPSVDGAEPPAVDDERLVTTLELPLGEWVTVARHDESGSSASSPRGGQAWRSGDATPGSAWVMQLRVRPR